MQEVTLKGEYSSASAQQMIKWLVEQGFSVDASHEGKVWTIEATKGEARDINIIDTSRPLIPSLGVKDSEWISVGSATDDTYVITKDDLLKATEATDA